MGVEQPLGSPILEVQGLHKRFGSVQAVAQVDFTVAQGELFGFLGPNGAGKTTTINMLTGLARPDGGSVRIAGIDCIANPRAAQHLIGVVPDESNLYPELSGFDNLCFCAALYGLPRRERQLRARQLLDQFGLSAAADRKFSQYSKGMKRKLTIAAGIIHRPPILFLDEPTTGIDVASARQVREKIADLHRQGTTIFLTTHYIEEAERLCQRIAFIVAGRIVRCATLGALLEPVRQRHQLLISCTLSDRVVMAELARHLAAVFPALQVQAGAAGQIRLEGEQPIAVGPLVRLIEAQGGEVFEARRLQPNLEEVFLQITGLDAQALQGEAAGRGRRGGQA
ncbi:ABC transporter ATP-binding protein [Desulfuromonas thiophila]|uniref:ABC-2 type transport system ATP-binding protein n=1 Tax=Desulfuromonas thiophila TaxID=57664 RepID=A0A1G7EMS0_9BACT|nr:ABC transporter ATP-binding protein [Desulfuromonas thiophila]SDE64927.1 ABC-2 type transport system ATP-binding protein [Desulfuromonas thiophila]